MIALVPRPAAATSCLPMVEQWIPDTDELLPVNALSHASYGCGADLSSWEVDVDGMPAELLYVEPPFGGFSIISMGIEPAPAEGAVVEIRGCTNGCWDEPVEFDITRTYTVSGEDSEAPEAPVVLELGHSDEIITEYDFETEEDVMRAVRRWNVHFESPALEEHVIWEIGVGPATGATVRARIMEDGDQNYVITRSISDAGLEVCATVRAYDLAGNVSDDSELCVQVDEDDELPSVPGSGTGDGGMDDGGSDDGGSDDGGSGDGGTGDGGSGDGGTSGGGADGGGGDGGMGGCSIAADRRGGMGMGALFGLMLLGLRRRWSRR